MPRARMIGRPHRKRSTPIGKFWMDRCVCAAQYTSAGTSMGPIESFSVLVLVMASIGTPAVPKAYGRIAVCKDALEAGSGRAGPWEGDRSMATTLAGKKVAILVANG